MFARWKKLRQIHLHDAETPEIKWGYVKVVRGGVWWKNDHWCTVFYPFNAIKRVVLASGKEIGENK